MSTAEGGTPSTGGTAKSVRLSGYMYRIEQRPIGGPTRRKYWFALSDETPYLYWYKNKTDLNCIGKIALSGSAFTFDPREKNRFEIHVNNENHLLETADSKSRDLWLRNLQNNRRRLYERENVENIAKVEIISQESYSTLVNPLAQPPREHFGTEMAEEVIVPGPSDEKNLEEEIVEATMSTFYLDANGELNPHSLEIPSPAPPSQDILRAAEDLIAKVTQNKDFGEPAKKALNKARTSFRFPTFSIGSGGKTCENCKSLIDFVDKLKERCYELTDAVSAHQELANTLRASLMVSTNQRLALEKQLENTAITSEHVQFVLNYEENLTALQLNATEQNREIQTLRKANKELADRNGELYASIEAYRDALRTKEEVILRMADEDIRDAPPPEVNYDDVAEALLVEGDENSVQQAQEDSVADLNELRDLVEGYKSQNQFLNDEILELQKIGQGLEDRESRRKKQNFELEARFYRLKSKYLMLLNHIKSAKKLSAINVEGVMHDLFAEVNNVGNLPHREGDSELGNSSILDRTSAEGDTIDALGFYLPATGLNISTNDIEDSGKSAENMVDRAVDLNKKSETIMTQIDSERSEKYQNWLVKWDSFLVNQASKPLIQSLELKALVRTGIPTTYRSRIWKSLLQLWTQVKQDDAGYGYYDCLVKKANTCDPDDSCIKQIDLDVSRTLPTNKYFDDPLSEKIPELKRVLYAFRFHNKSIGYCQGLNRIAAIALLFLNETDAFWFMVAFVEHLQPQDYYTSDLACAVADQKVLLDITREKLPKLDAHLRKLEVDLTPFTLSWFLTCFVDVLPHKLYIPIFDIFLYEGNKVIFRFALAILKLCEPRLLQCPSSGSIHGVLSNLGGVIQDYNELSNVAFTWLNPFPLKTIESKRQSYLKEIMASHRA